jgi:hypothetical protein
MQGQYLFHPLVPKAPQLSIVEAACDKAGFTASRRPTNENDRSAFGHVHPSKKTVSLENFRWVRAGYFRQRCSFHGYSGNKYKFSVNNELTRKLYKTKQFKFSTTINVLFKFFELTNEEMIRLLIKIMED